MSINNCMACTNCNPSGNGEWVCAKGHKQMYKYLASTCDDFNKHFVADFASALRTVRHTNWSPKTKRDNVKLPYDPEPNTVRVLVNGLCLQEGKDYSVNNGSVIFAEDIVQPFDNVDIQYVERKPAQTFQRGLRAQLIIQDEGEDDNDEL